MDTFLSLNKVRALLDEYDLTAKKSRGQNFLTDGNILRKIVNSLKNQQSEYIVEIGPGLGSLTGIMAGRGYKILAIEVDNDLEELLQSQFMEDTKVKLKFADVLEQDIEAVLKEVFDLEKVPCYQVCANIPYNITSPIIFKLLEECPHLEAATLMIQKEVAERVMAVPGNKDYGRLTINCNYLAHTEILFKVGRGCFFPRPQVDSAVLRFIPYRDKPVQATQEKTFKELVKFAFQRRRKTLLNIVSDFFNQPKDEIDDILVELGFDGKLRPENLGIEQWVKLSNAFTEKK